nr:helix-hairpin-helix domain-containing protein [Acinetobacter sp.]
SSSHYLSKPALSSASNSQKIKLNSASAELFQQLSGIGQKKAEAIVAYRSKNGKFKSIDEIQDVKGIGPAIFAKNKDRLAL